MTAQAAVAREHGIGEESVGDRRELLELSRRR